MESNIKVKATNKQMDFFASHFCVKGWERIEWLNDKKGRSLWKVFLRHGEEHKLHGTYTVETIMEKLRKEACHINLEATIASALDECFTDLSFFNETDKMKDVINKALNKYNLKVS